MPAFSNYLKQLFIGVATMIAIIVALNALIDPYGLFRMVTIPGLNETKSRASQRGEVFKREAVESLKPNTLILGNSMAEIGFDPAHSAWPTEARPVFNAALPGTGMLSASRQLRESFEHTRPKLVVIGLNFPDFRVDANPALRHPLPLRTALEKWRDRTLALASLDATLDSLATIRFQQDPYAPRLTATGFNPMLDYAPIARNDGYHAMFAQRNRESAKNLAKGSKQVFRADGSPAVAFEAIFDIAALGRSNGIRMVFIIYPYHADLLTLFDRAGLWPAFEVWKRELVKIADTATAGKDGQVELWDFSGLSAYTSEAVPGVNDKRQEMRWYWEAGHFKKSLGDKVLDVSLGGVIAQPEFGVRLTKDNVEEELQRQRLSLVRYQDENKQRTQLLNALFESSPIVPPHNAFKKTTYQ